MNIRCLLLPALIALGILAAACGPSGDAKKDGSGTGPSSSKVAIGGPDDRTLRVNIGTEPDTLDSSLMQGIPESKVLAMVGEGLVRLDEKTNPLPGVAEKWEHSDDQTVWTFHLRKNAKWHNGDPVTAHDFVYATRRILDSRTAAKYADYVKAVLKGGDEFYANPAPTKETPLPGIEAVDDHTLRYTLNYPIPYFTSIISHSSFYPLNERAIREGGEKTWAATAKTFVGNGAFRIESWRPTDRMVLKKFDGYWGKDEVWFDEIIVRVIDNETTELQAFESRELDITERVPLPDVPRLKQTPYWHDSEYLGVYYFNFNLTRPPFDNVDVRRALSWSLDRKEIVENLLRRGETPASGFVPVGIPGPDGRDFRATSPVEMKFDPEAAKEALKRAGYGPGGKPFPAVELLYNTSEEHKTIAEAVQAMWSSTLGIKVELQNVEWKVRIERGNNQQFDIVRAGWIADYVDPINFLEIMKSDNELNNGKYNNPEFDRLVRGARVEGDAAKRWEMLTQAEKILMEDMAIAPLFYYTNIQLVRDNVKGMIRNVLGNQDVTRARRVAVEAK